MIFNLPGSIPSTSEKCVALLKAFWGHPFCCPGALCPMRESTGYLKATENILISMK